jgi:hypothetical protein
MAALLHLRVRQDIAEHTSAYVADSSASSLASNTLLYPRQTAEAHTTTYLSDASASIPSQTSSVLHLVRDVPAGTTIHISDPSVAAPASTPRLHVQQEIGAHTTVHISNPPASTSVLAVAWKATRPMARTPRSAVVADYEAYQPSRLVARAHDLTGMTFTTMLPDSGPPADTSFLLVGLVFSLALGVVAAAIGAAIWARSEHVSLRAFLRGKWSVGAGPSASVEETEFLHVSEKVSAGGIRTPAIHITLPSPVVSVHSVPKVTSLLGAKPKVLVRPHPGSKPQPTSRAFGFPVSSPPFSSPPLSNRGPAAPPPAHISRSVRNHRRLSTHSHTHLPPSPIRVPLWTAADDVDSDADGYMSLPSDTSSSSNNSSEDGARGWPLTSVSTRLGLSSDTEGSCTEGEVATGFALRSVRARSVEVRAGAPRLSSSASPEHEMPVPKHEAFAGRLSPYPVETFLSLHRDDATTLSYGSSKTLDLDDFPSPPSFGRAL